MKESYFMWCFGVLEPGYYGTVEIKTGKSTLFVPRLPSSYAIWMGPLLTLDNIKNKYLVDEVHYIDEVLYMKIRFKTLQNI